MCKGIVRECSGVDEGRKGSMIEELNCDAVSAEAPSNLMESSKAGITLQICPNLGQGVRSLYLHFDQSLDVNLPGRGSDLEGCISLSQSSHLRGLTTKDMSIGHL